MKILRMLLMKLMSLDDVTEAGVICITGLIIFAIACFVNTAISWAIVLFFIVLVCFVGVLEEYIEKENKRAKKNHDYFLEQTRNYMATVEKCDSFVKNER